MEKSSYQKLKEKLNRVDFMSKYFIKKYTEELTGDYDKDRYNEGIIAAMAIIQNQLNEDEKGND